MSDFALTYTLWYRLPGGPVRSKNFRHTDGGYLIRMAQDVWDSLQRCGYEMVSTRP